jgi:hypothetical protein
MAENQTKENTKSRSATAGKNGFEQMFPVNFAQIQARNMATAAHANEILVRTAKAMWEKQTELFKLEAEQSRNLLAPIKPEGNPMAAFSGFWDRWHAHAEKSIANMRALNDLARDCQWELQELANQNISALGQREAAE